jgi:glycosyltransferase involved in cell wall biosynthesis
MVRSTNSDWQRALHQPGDLAPSAVSLAIVIPAWKGRFFDETLASIAAQTCQAFTVYIGDDCSPDGIEAICQRWAPQINIIYHRFPDNLGARDLPLHIERSIELSSESWVWVFGDDDTMDEECVERFYQQVTEGPVPPDVYHFNTRVIDHEGKVVSCSPAFPATLTAIDYLWKHMTGRLSSYLPDFVFRRDAFDQLGGLPNFPQAWFTDTALWVTLGRDRGISTIAGPRVNWRFSGENISSNHARDRHVKLDAAISYLCWVDEHLKQYYDDLIKRRFAPVRLPWLVRHSRSLGFGLRPLVAATASNIRQSSNTLRKVRYYLSLVFSEMVYSIAYHVRRTVRLLLGRVRRHRVSP